MLPTWRTSPRRLVPVGTSGLRLSYSASPSSFQSITSRAVRRYSCRSAFASEVGTAAVCHRSECFARACLSLESIEFIGYFGVCRTPVRYAVGMLEGLDEAIDALHAVDLDSLSDQELDDCVVGLQASCSRLAA